MPSKNLQPRQYQLGDFVFGDGTLFNVTQFDIGGWDVNTQDYQAQLSDEIQFGSDSFKVNPIQIGMTVRTNRTLENIAALTQDSRVAALNYANDPKIGEFTREWRADEIRKQWGALKNLYVCRPDGRTVEIFGRPGKMAVSKEDPKNRLRLVTAEFRRSDTLCYNDFEWFTQVRDGESVMLFRATEREDGDAPAWVRFLLVGPMTHPIINLGYTTIELDYEIQIGEVVEISSYPWQRRVVRLNDGANLAACLVTPYLSELNFDVNEVVQLSWTATNVNQQVKAVDISALANAADGFPAGSGFNATVYTEAGAGTAHVSGGKYIWTDSGNGNRTAVNIFDYPTVGSYQIVGMTVANPAEAPVLSEECTNRIIGRAKEDGSEYLYWDIGFGHFWFGYHQNGVDTQVSPKYEVASFMNLLQHYITAFFDSLFGNDENWIYEAEFGTGEGPRSSTLKINGVNVFTFRDQDTLTSAVGWPSMEANLYTGMGMRATSRVLGQSTPGTVSEFHMRDNPADPVEVSGVYMFWRDAWQNI